MAKEINPVEDNLIKRAAWILDYFHKPEHVKYWNCTRYLIGGCTDIRAITLFNICTERIIELSVCRDGFAEDHDEADDGGPLSQD
jgi:hypothetical protein